MRPTPLPFELLEPIASGPEATPWYAIDLERDAPVAIQTVAPGEARNTEATWAALDELGFDPDGVPPSTADDALAYAG
jgi:hypothetical protein